MQGKPSQNFKTVYVAGAKDWNATACTTEWICLKNAQTVRWVINCGVINASSSGAVTLTQATSDGGSPLALSALATYDLIDGETVTETTVTSNTFNLATGHSNKVIVIELDSAKLNRTSGYDWVTLNIASPGSYSTIYSVTADVFNLGYGTESVVLT
jgi:hypothetical protein